VKKAPTGMSKAALRAMLDEISSDDEWNCSFTRDGVSSETHEE
jgi:hypothetical protein